MCSQSAKSDEDRPGETAEEAAGPNPGLIASVPVTRRRDGESFQVTDSVIRESSLVLQVDGRIVCRLRCSPTQLEELALGFLCTAGVLPPEATQVPMTCETDETETRLDVSLGLADDKLTDLRDSLVAGTGCGLGVFSTQGLDPLDCRRKIDMSFRIPADDLRELMRTFQKKSQAYQETGGVHSAAIAGRGELVAFAEDVGRHNAVDKAIGCCLRRGVALHDKVALSTGRLSLDLVAKGVRAGLPLVASRAAPTDAAVQLARLANLTLIGFVRGSRMNIYTAEWRVE